MMFTIEAELRQCTECRAPLVIHNGKIASGYVVLARRSTDPNDPLTVTPHDPLCPEVLE